MIPSTHTYDVVIIGSGLGGLLCATILAKEGMKVCVLEQDKQIGGLLQTFSLQKTVFDSCVHYIGGLGKGHTLWHIFRYAGIMDKLVLTPLDANGFDRIAFADEATEYPLAIGDENFVERLSVYFPNERTALQQYIDTLKSTSAHFPLYHLRNGDAAEKNAVTGWSLTEKLQGITGNKLLQNVLAGNNLLYAGVAGKTPFYLHALVEESYMHSAHKVVPGSSQIAKFLWQELQAHGGVIYRNTEVVKLVEEGGEITHAICTDGNHYYGKHFIANMHPAQLVQLTDSSMIRPVYRNRVSGVENTVSAFMLNLVLKPGTVPVRNHNLYWHATHDVWHSVNYDTINWPEGYALYYTEDTNNPGYAESLSILAYMRYDEAARWSNTLNRTNHQQDRGADYEAFKAEKSELLLQKVYDRVPELKGVITAQSAATPLTYRDYSATPQGSIYGILKDVNKPAETTVATRTRIPNLYLTGQNVNLHGVLGVSITAIATCAELLGLEYLLKKIKS